MIGPKLALPMKTSSVVCTLTFATLMLLSCSSSPPAATTRIYPPRTELTTIASPQEPARPIFNNGVTDNTTNYEDIRKTKGAEYDRAIEQDKAVYQAAGLMVLGAGAVATGAAADKVGDGMNRVIATRHTEVARSLTDRDGQHFFRVKSHGGMISPHTDVIDKDGRTYGVSNVSPIDAKVGDPVTLTVSNGRVTEIYNQRSGKKSSVAGVR